MNTLPETPSAPVVAPVPDKSVPADVNLNSLGDVDPAHVIPLDAARAHLRHWWREPVAGFIAVFIGVFDSWYFPRDQGLSSSLDEILVIGGIVLIAGSKRLFGGTPSLIETKEKK
jgi:hypothetical protein